MFVQSSSSRQTIEFRAVDILFIGFTALISILIVLFRFNVEGWQRILLNNVLVTTLFFVSLWVISRVQNPLLHGVLRIGLCLIAISFLFETTGKIVHIFFPEWFDAVIAHLEYSLLGVYPTVWLQKLTSPLMTEWMMFAYVIYGPMMPFIGYLAFREGGSEALEGFLTDLALANIICFIGFLLVPVDWPGRLLGSYHTVPLKGYFFTSIADSLRTDVHFPGGCLPSPHCAASTVMLVAAFRYHRKVFIALLPIIVSIYISTVYGRFHYATDVPAGILTAVLALWLSPKICQAWDGTKLILETKRIVKPVVIQQTLTEEE